jgi:hypothetical protein
MTALERVEFVMIGGKVAKAPGGAQALRGTLVN